MQKKEKKNSFHRYPNEYLKNEYDIIYLHTQRGERRTMIIEWVEIRETSSRYDVTIKLLTKFLFCEKEKKIIRRLWRQQTMNIVEWIKKIRTNSVNKSQTEVDQIFSSLLSLSIVVLLRNSCPEGSFDAFNIYKFFVIHTKKKRRREKHGNGFFEYHLTFLHHTFLSLSVCLYLIHANTGQQKGSNLRKFPLTRRKIACRENNSHREKKRNKENQ